MSVYVLYGMCIDEAKPRGGGGGGSSRAGPRGHIFGQMGRRGDNTRPPLAMVGDVLGSLPRLKIASTALSAMRSERRGRRSAEPR